MLNKKKWGQKKILNFYNHNRNKWSDLYKGEKFLIKILFKKNYSVLDIGCAQGGLNNALTKITKNFSYTGLDYNKSMILKARKKFPKKEFVILKNSSISKILKKKYDIVFVLGILHLNKNWKKIIKEAYKLSKKHIVFDLRETDAKINKKIFQNLNLNKNFKSANKIVYNILNKKNVKIFINKNFKKDKIRKIEYTNLPSIYTNYKKKISFCTYSISK